MLDLLSNGAEEPADDLPGIVGVRVAVELTPHG